MVGARKGAWRVPQESFTESDIPAGTFPSGPAGLYRLRVPGPTVS